MLFRLLTDKEIDALTACGCTADDWKNVEVADGFKPDYVQNVHFSGKIRLGVFEKTFEFSDGVWYHSGVFNCVLCNSTVGNNVYVSKIHNYIANCEIGEGSFIENVNKISSNGKCAFGNGTAVNVLNESGVRKIRIFDTLSAPLAYIFTMFRHRSALIEKLEQLVDNYAESVKSSTGKIGKNVKIINCGTIQNVNVGDNAEIADAANLENGSINSTENAPVIIGCGVKMRNFIVSSQSEITDFALLENCFVGQNCKIGKQFSAVDSLFFANCEMMHGEAVSVFSAPHCVSHHKSTLLIAGMYSFFNAGSGANQSNHNYRLGAVHQGVFERGTKFGSSSYLLLPARTGAFTLVVGRHKSHPDTAALPFSYLVENNNETYLLPARNLVSAGFRRDAEKWQKRDARKTENRLDCIVYEQLNPFTVKEIRNALALLATLQEEEKAEIYSYGNCKITREALRKGISYYAMVIDFYFGTELKKLLANTDLNDSEKIRRKLQPVSEAGTGEWLDLAGLAAPKSEIDALVNNIESGKLNLAEINAELHSICNSYAEYKHNWLVENILDVFGKLLDQITADDIQMWLALHEIQRQKYLSLLEKDAQKDIFAL